MHIILLVYRIVKNIWHDKTQLFRLFGGEKFGNNGEWILKIPQI